MKIENENSMLNFKFLEAEIFFVKSNFKKKFEVTFSLNLKNKCLSENT